MPSYFYRLILAISLLLPFAAQASDAGDFAAASSSRQAELLEAWAASPVPERIELLEALRDGRVAADSSKRAWIENNDKYGAVDANAPAAADAPTPDEPRKLRLNNRLRGLVDT
ncbi:Branched-chain amino acid ABC transporter, permease protein, partial [Pseudomonas syringae pv. maculicola]